MKVEELMIGDWVTYKGKLIMVYGINESFVDGQSILDVINYDTDGYYGISYIRADEVSPIPLTEEIFIKSGFVKTGTDEVCYRYSKGTDDYYCRVEISRQRGEWFVNARKFSINNIPYDREFKGLILFLHELQHILRVTGIEKEVKV